MGRPFIRVHLGLSAAKSRFQRPASLAPVTFCFLCALAAWREANAKPRLTAPRRLRSKTSLKYENPPAGLRPVRRVPPRLRFLESLFRYGRAPRGSRGGFLRGLLGLLGGGGRLGTLGAGAAGGAACGRILRGRGLREGYGSGDCEGDCDQAFLHFLFSLAGLFWARLTFS
jgi:hypothetical protein